MFTKSDMDAFRAIVNEVLEARESETFSRLPKVIEVTGLGRSSIYNKIADGTFPKPVKLEGGGRMNCWITSEVYGWIEKQIEAHRAS